MKRVILIDDNLIDQTILTKLFSHYGVKLETANDGEEGIKLTKQIIPALILLDIKMPVMDGFEALVYFKADIILQNIPIVMLSADLISKEVENLLLVNAVGLLKKPVFPKDIKALLEKYKILEVK
ncbi:response regulator [Chitinophaga niabensis]|uniref:Two-component system, cell cycle response regulator DivK n=1 Tax=Chitinophaga niabensis TaxID=536979 RepID=A0A1N6KAR7_9BACT|nr:response regulator [Chitinophaga niabensis]SIO53563.1 two-component system, cell cycle response regulator DivK [Chitinophaga niabensis]